MNIFEKFPKSELMSVLLEKIGNNNERYNSLMAEVCRFREHIVQELRQINELFPEYTPHDEDYHISHLFKIADILLGKVKYEKMNIIELVLLVVSMYAHDWGMAVSKKERYYIATRKDKDSISDIVLLEDEYDRFEYYIKGKLGITEIENDEQIDITVWQEYIRNTHAMRSGKRVYSFFGDFNNSIAGALEKICVGHWLEIEEITESNGYYRDASVFGENVNLKALSVYIRLVDLFDLAEDRTPYVLWKYVNPQNQYSRMEWEKHRALHPITCPSYEKGRVICISGSTDNHEVYAALIDFKKICERYFRECIDLIAHMSDQRHELGVHLLDWRIEARNFKPIDVSFSFNKEHIFKILGDEVYNCHPYVYIRELIQNSIDAIALRKKVLDRKKVGGDNIGYINISVEWESEEDLVVLCSDDGIGMDEYVLRNYFSVLGRSYYNSDDFKKKGIEFDSISKFGIGILSCFSVASRMEISTRREPYMEEGRKGLKVIINDIRNTFRIEEIPEYKCDVGTEIKLFIKKKDLMKQLEDNKCSIESYNITDYIKKIVSFVQYPIVVNENHITTIVLPSGFDQNRIKGEKIKLSECDIVYEVDSYPIKETVFEQDEDTFNEFFEIRKIDVNKDLGMNGIEGAICFAILRDYNNEIKCSDNCWPAEEILVKNKRIRWKENDRGVMVDNDDFFSHNYHIKIYNKGILLEHQKGVWDKERFRFRTHLFPVPFIKINFPKTISDISVSRFFGGTNKELLDDLWKKLSYYISEELRRDIIMSEDHYLFWKKLNVYVMQYHLDVEMLDEDLFQNVKYPFIDCEGKLIFESIEDYNTITLLPDKRKDIMRKFSEEGKYEHNKDWEYGKCLLTGDFFTFYDETVSLNICLQIYDVFSKKYCLKEVVFKNDEEFTLPLAQYTYQKGNDSYIIKRLAEILSEFGASYEQDSKRIKELYDELWGLKNIVAFSGDFSQCFAYGNGIYNVENNKVQKLIIYHWLIDQLLGMKKYDTIMLKIKKDILFDLPFSRRRYYYNDHEISFSEINGRIKEFHNWIKGYYTNIDEASLFFTKEDFVEGTIEIISEDCFKFTREDRIKIH